MVQIGSNLNVGKTVKLTSAVQVGQTGEVNNPKQPKVKPAAVWIGLEQDDSKYRENDVILYLSKDGTFLAKRLVNSNGRLIAVTIDPSQITNDDFESDRGNIHDPSTIF